MNKELESMAKILYDYWFVQFDFPNVDGKPYKSSGGEMIYNDVLKREIPKGWDAINLESLISRSGTGLNPRDNFQLGNGQNYYVTIKNVSNGKITLDEKCDRISDDALAIIDRRSQLQAGDILFTSIEPVGITYFIHEKPNNWNINESVFTIRPQFNKITSEYLFFLLSSDQMKSFTKNSSTGSIHKGIRHGVLKSFMSAYGGKELVDHFSSITKPILQQMNVLENENQHLSQLHNWLLPMLMNGQVTVSQ
jgi:type I restriction enzyme S subunit